MSAITYFHNQTRYYASIIRCSVREVFERMGEIAWANWVVGTMNIGSQNLLILCNMACCNNSKPGLKGMQRYSLLVVFSHSTLEGDTTPVLSVRDSGT